MEGEGTKHGPPCGPGPWTTYVDPVHGPLFSYLEKKNIK